MKNISIKSKITLWYTVFMTLLVVLALGLLLAVSSTRLLSGANNRLKNMVLRSYKEISCRDGLLKFDNSFTFLGLEKGIYLSAYDTEGNFLYGRLPSYYSGTPDLIMDELQQEYDFYTQWYIYDYCMYVENYGNVWIRGITSQTEADRIMTTILRLSLVILPFFVVCIVVGGYCIIRRALAPLDAVTNTAQEISRGSDLSKRLQLKNRGDEVHRLAHTFDLMMDRLQDAFETEKQFTSDVSHELRTPVSVILALCEYGMSENASPAESAGCLKSIMIQAKKMSNLISQLLTLARTDSGKQQLHLELINLSELTDIIIEEQQLAAAEKNITITGDISPDILIRADETMMMRFFINLISNSITYGKVNGHIWISLHLRDGDIHGSVSDDGIGIPKEHLENIWKRFYQADPSRSSSNGSGAGLGLPMVRWIVTAHGGEIHVESTPGKGTAFIFSFPNTSDKNGLSFNPTLI